MTEYLSQIIIAVLGLVGAVIGSYMANNKTQALLNYRMDAMEKKLDKAEKDLEPIKERVTILERDSKTAFNRIDELREDIKEVKKEK